MNRAKVKICGITNYQDASIAIGLGVDALGFIFAPSPRKIDPGEACAIIRSLPPFVTTVGVFVNEKPATIREIIRLCGLDMIQLHGDEPPDFCHAFMPRTIKAFRLKDDLTVESTKLYCGKVRAFLYDTYSEQKKGGTGKTFNWDLAVKGKGLGVPIILSGGITLLNVEPALNTVRPYAIDVNSGVEECPGKKSPILMTKLMETVRKMTVGGMLNEGNGLLR